ncbi:MAG: hypothetical protein CMH50_14895, partial [Myxococcales bacterium]|nr:hypothetical protein [Myxococcales bacterium]
MPEIPEAGALTRGRVESLVRRSLRSGESLSLQLAYGEDEGEIFIADGKITAAKAGQLEGEQALTRLWSLESGSFAMKRGQVAKTVMFEQSTAKLLLAADRHQARWDRYVDRMGDLNRVFFAPQGAAEASGLPAPLRPFLDRFDGETSVAEVIYGSDLDDLMALRLVSKLVEQDVLDEIVQKEEAVRDVGAEKAAAEAWLDGHSGVFENPFAKSEQEEAVSDAFGEFTDPPEKARVEESVPRLEPKPEPKPEPQPEPEP